jgi:hypothetical protein
MLTSWHHFCVVVEATKICQLLGSYKNAATKKHDWGLDGTWGVQSNEMGSDASSRSYL